MSRRRGALLGIALSALALLGLTALQASCGGAQSPHTAVPAASPPVAAVVDAGPFGWLPAVTVVGRKVAFWKTER